jgi:hypothetical protein
MALTATAINAAKPRDKPYKLADGLGLYLLVAPTGGRLWRMNYRFLGQQKTLSIGSYQKFLSRRLARREQQRGKRWQMDKTRLKFGRPRFARQRPNRKRPSRR